MTETEVRKWARDNKLRYQGLDPKGRFYFLDSRSIGYALSSFIVERDCTRAELDALLEEFRARKQ